jgi:predicted nucleic acid-binding Zn ribbon protein
MVFKESNEQSLKEVIEKLLKSYRLDGKLYEQRLISKYPEVVGPMIARYTDSIRIRNKTLFLEISSPVVSNELTYARSTLLRSLNKEAGKEVIDKIVIK